MIVHRIEIHKPPAPSEPTGKPKHITHLLKQKFNGKHGTTDHRKFIHKRAVAECPFSKGDKVLLRKNVYEVTDIYGEKDFEYITWNGLAPEFVEIMDDYGEIKLANPGSLKKYRK